MSKKITLIEWAQQNNVVLVTARKYARNGRLVGARKIEGKWVVPFAAAVPPPGDSGNPNNRISKAPYAERLDTAKKLLRHAGWIATDTTFNYDAVVSAVFTQFGYAHRQRARILVATAARRMRYEFVRNPEVEKA